MFKSSINPQVFKDISWLHWALTVPLLTAYLAGLPGALGVAIALSVVACGYFLDQLKQFRPYPVQVRIAYLGLLLMGVSPGMAWVHWVQCLGTTSMVLVGYCPLMRMLSLFPFNRNEPLTLNVIRRAFFGEPCVGGLIQWSSETPAMLSCSLPIPIAQRDSSFQKNCHLQQEALHAQAH